MSIILKGIDLPKDRDCVNLSIYQNGDVYEQMDNGFYIIINAEAIQIPTPHGRLIDASGLIKSYMKGTKAGIDDFYDTIDIIDNAPTILEAEE